MGSLVGLELRPRRLREAAAMWRAVTDAVGTGARDSLWDYPDLMPTASDIDDPAGSVADTVRSPRLALSRAVGASATIVPRCMTTVRRANCSASSR